MKKIFLVLLVCSIQVFSQNYFPLHKGNLYQYINQYGSIGGPLGGNNNKVIENYTITKDTIVNNKQYFYFNNSFYRYDTLSQKMYMLINGNDTFAMDFNDSANIRITRNYFGRNLLLIGAHSSYYNTSYSTYWAPDLGIVNMNSSSSDPHMGMSDSHSELVEAFIYGDSSFIHYTYNYKPSFSLLDNHISGYNLLFSVRVNHPFTDTSLMEYGQPVIFNYIDSVYLVGLYKKGNEVIPKDTMKFSSNKLIYSINYRLDSALINNGYSFYYKAVAKDKGIVPVYTSYPDTGCYCKDVFSVYNKNCCPLHKGNTYQYLVLHTNTGGQLRDSSYEEIENYTIKKDTVINHYQYFLFLNEYLRYDSTQNKLYKLVNSTDSLCFDYNSALAIQKEDSYFGFKLHVIGYDSLSEKKSKIFWAPNFGMMEKTTYVEDQVKGSSQTSKKLVDALIFNKEDGLFTHSAFYAYPEFKILENALSHGKLKFSLNINHPLNDTSNSFSYLGDVHLSGSYRLNYDYIPFNNVYFLHSDNSNIYSLELALDTLLLNRGYTFCYKVKTIDKGIFPISSEYPYSNYFEIDNSKSTDYADNYVLFQNYPNPFNSSTNIKYSIPCESNVKISIYNALGYKIRDIVNSRMIMDNYEIKFDGTGLASGVYFVTIKASSIDGKKSYIQTKKMILMK